MRDFDKSKADFLYGIWVSIVIGMIVALSINLIHVYQIVKPNSDALTYLTQVSLIGALIGILIHFLQGFIIYLFRNVKNKHIMGVALFVSSYVLTFLVIYILGYRDNKVLFAVSLVPSVYGTIFAYFEMRRITKLNCGLQKKKDELSKKIKSSGE